MALTDQVLMPGSDYQAICDATRNLTGKTETLKSGDISTELRTIGIVEQATPSLSVNTATGLVTAEATQAAGLVAAGTKKATMQLPTQAAKTITPSSSAQIAVPAGKYTTGAVKVAPVPTETKTVDLSMFSGNQVIVHTPDKFMKSVTVKKPDTLVAKNVRFNNTIGGVTGTYYPHVCVFPELISVDALLMNNTVAAIYNVEFWYGDNEYCTAIRATPQKVLSYYHESVGEWHEVYKNNQWLAEAYRKIVLTEYKSNVETALRKVGYIQENQAVDPSVIHKVCKSNGSYGIRPDAPYNGISGVMIQVDVPSGVDLPFTKLATVSTDNGILSFSFTGYYNTIIAKRSGTNKILTAVFGSGLKASFSIGSEGEDLSTSGFSFDYVGGKFNVTWNICGSSGSVWYEGSYDIYGCTNG